MEEPEPLTPAAQRERQRHIDEACWGLRNAEQWLLAYVPGPAGAREGEAPAEGEDDPAPRGPIVLGSMARNSLDVLAGPLLRTLVDEAVDARLAELDAEAED